MAKKPSRDALTVLGTRSGPADFRHDFEQDRRPDGNLPGEGAAVGGKQNDGDANRRSKDCQDKPVGSAIVAVDQGDGDQREADLHKQCGPLHPIDRGPAEDDALTARSRALWSAATISRWAAS